ncbi:MAG: hypothetical protein IH905_10675 [Proteobacteria bacterium]|nr:hypothetical protein [Pseudomonadota bacterium]
MSPRIALAWPSLPVRLAATVEVEAGLKVGDLVVSRRRPQYLDGAILLGDGVVELPDIMRDTDAGLSCEQIEIEMDSVGWEGFTTTIK